VKRQIGAAGASGHRIFSVGCRRVLISFFAANAILDFPSASQA